MADFEALSRYIETLTISQGQGVGSPLRLLPWERRFLQGAFGPGVELAALSVGRGNGKTTLAAAIAAAAVDGPLAQPRGQCVVVASSLNQARLLFGHVKAFLEGLHGGKLKRPTWRAVASPNEVSIRHLPSGAEVKAIAADPGRAHGLAPVLVLLDEPSQWPRATADRMFAALETSLGKLPNSRLVALGTRPVAGSGHFFETLLAGGADFATVHAAPRDADPLDRRAWRDANPSLDAFPHLAETIRRAAGRAAKNPELLPQFRALRLNSGVPDAGQNELVTAAAWERCMGSAEMEPPISWGIDLASGGAMSALAAFSLETGALQVLAAFPSVPDLAERGLRDGVGPMYEVLHERGELLVHPGRVVQVPWLLAEGLKRFGPPSLLAADYHRRAELRDALDAAAVPGCKLELRKGGFGDGAEDVSRFRRAVLDRRVVAARSRLLTIAVGEARTVASPAGEEKLAKSSQGGRRQLARDDCAAASILSVSVGERNRRAVTARTGGVRVVVAR